jgi:GT2 family glycosyltransferase
MPDPTILTVILNYRTPEMTLKAAAAAVREMAGLRGETVIVDNASPDDSFDMISAALRDQEWAANAPVRVVQSGRNGGFGAGNNFAIRQALTSGFESGPLRGRKPDFVYILNSDAWPDPGAIKRLRDFMVANPKAGIAGSAVRGADDVPHNTAFRFPSAAGGFEAAARTGIFSRLLANSIVALPIPRIDTQVDWVAGASMMIRSAMLRQIGLFDETFFLYFEETDLCRRAARSGWRTFYVPGSTVVHIGSASTGMKTWRRTPTYWFDSRLNYLAKTHGAAYTALATLALIAGCLIWRLRRLISDKPQGDPTWFLRDLIIHSLRAMFRRPRRAAPSTRVTLTRTVAEDRK